MYTASRLQGKSTIILIFISCFCSNFAVFAQQNDNPKDSANLQINQKPAYYFGGFLDVNLNMHSADFTTLSKDFATCCPKYESAFGVGFSLGGLFEMPISNDAKWLFGTRLGYASVGAEFAESNTIGNTEVQSVDGSIVTQAKATYYLDSRLNLINLNPYASYNIWNSLFASAGLNLGFLFSNSMDMREELTSPASVVYTTTGTRVRNNYTNQEIPDINPMQFGLSLGLAYQLPIGKNSFLIPEARYNLALTNVSAVDWKANYFQLGVGVKFPYYKSEEIVNNVRYERDTIIEKRYDVKEAYVELVSSETFGNDVNSVIVEKYKLFQPATAALTASFKAFGLNNGQRQFNPTVIIEEFETTERFPVLPVVYFPDGDADISKTRMNLLNQLNRSNFSEDSLKVDMMDVYYNMLNLVGKRLNENPDSKIVIKGYSSGEGKDRNNPNIWRERAENVKKYFINVWNISENQLSIEQGQLPQRNVNPKSLNDAIEENQKVELVTTDFKLIEPVQLYQIERVANPPQIEFETQIESEAGIDNYVLEVAQGNTPIRRFVGRATNDNIIWDIGNDPVPLLEAPVRATFKAKDIIGQTKDVVQEITIEQQTIKKKRQKIEGDMKVERYSLILFEYDKAEISQLDKHLLQDAQTNIQPDSRVIISGFADRTGDTQYNKNLARKRCEEVKKNMQIDSRNSVSIDAAGSERLIFNNALPEGRALSRTVRIEIKTPVK